MIRVLLIFLFISNAHFICGQEDPHKWLITGDAYYKKGEYYEAEEAYRKASEIEPGVKSKYNLGNSVYNQTRYDEAIDHYQRAVESADNPDHKSSAYYNLGNAHYMAQQYDKSVDAYKEALKINPDDIDAKKNLTLAQKLLKRQQQQQQQSQDNQDQDQKQKEQEQQQQDNSNQKESEEDQTGKSEESEEESEKEQNEESESEGDDKNEENTSTGKDDPKQDLSREEAARLLKIMEQEDQKVQEKLRRSSGRKNKSAKEW